MHSSERSAVIFAIVIAAVAVALGLGAATCACLRAAKQRELRRMLLSTLAVLHAANIKYVLSWGTLLGAVREGRIIPHDDDADILIFGEPELQRARAALAAARIPDTTLISKPFARVKSTKPGARTFVDMYVADLRPLTPNASTRFWVQRDVGGAAIEKESALPENTPLTSETRRIHGFAAFVPANPHALLRRIYGATYMTPQHRKAPNDSRNGSWQFQIQMAARHLGLYV